MSDADSAKFDSKYPIPQSRLQIEALESQLGRIAGEWRVTENPVYIKLYHDTYHKLVALGWDSSVHVEAELPYDLMPEHYLDVLRRAGWLIDGQGNVLGLQRHFGD